MYLRLPTTTVHHQEDRGACPSHLEQPPHFAILEQVLEQLLLDRGHHVVVTLHPVMQGIREKRLTPSALGLGLVATASAAAYPQADACTAY